MDLVERLREMAGAASSLPNLPEIGGTTDVIEEIGRTSLEAARIVHEYAGPSIRGKASMSGSPFTLPGRSTFSLIFFTPVRMAKHSLSDMPSRIYKCQMRCIELTEILDRRVHMDTNARVKGIQGHQIGSLWVQPSCWSPSLFPIYLEKDIDTWMCAPDTSPNFNAACKKHQPETGSWFLSGPAFMKWKEHPDVFLWLHGDR